MNARLWVAVLAFLFVLVTLGGGCGGGGNATDGDGGGLPSNCTNGYLDGDETDTDCGGACNGCSEGYQCKESKDCATKNCATGYCGAALAGPVIKDFYAAKTKLTVGTPAELVAIFSGGTAAVDHQVGPIENAKPIASPPVMEPTEFRLTVVSEEGLSTTRSVKVETVAAAKIESFTAEKTAVPAGQGTTIKPVFSGGTGTIAGIGPVTSGVSIPTGNLTKNAHYVLTVVNEIGDSVIASVDVEAAVTPVITGFSAPGALVSRFAPTLLTATFTGGTGKIDLGVGNVQSGTPVKTPEVPFAGATYTLTVTNGLGESVTRQLSVGTKKEIFVADYGADVLVFDIDDVGDVEPKRILVTDLTILGIMGMWADNGDLYVANEGGTPSISVFKLDQGARPPYKDGGAYDMPKRKISGAGSTIDGVNMFSIANGEIFVGDRTSTVKVWNTTDTGSVAPKRTITGAATGLDNALDAFVSGGEVFVSNYASGGAGSITVYPQSASGNTAPSRTIATDLPTGILVEGNEIFVTSKAGEVTVYNKTTGAQLRKLSGMNTQMTEAYQCSVAGSELFCTDYASDKVVVFPTTANGNVAPTRVITGNKTYMSATSCVYVY